VAQQGCVRLEIALLSRLSVSAASFAAEHRRRFESTLANGWLSLARRCGDFAGVLERVQALRQLEASSDIELWNDPASHDADEPRHRGAVVGAGRGCRDASGRGGTHGFRAAGSSSSSTGPSLHTRPIRTVAPGLKRVGASRSIIAERHLPVLVRCLVVDQDTGRAGQRGPGGHGAVWRTTSSCSRSRSRMRRSASPAVGVTAKAIRRMAAGSTVDSTAGSYPVEVVPFRCLQQSRNGAVWPGV